MKRKGRFQNPWGKDGEYYNQSAVGGSTNVEPPTSLVSGTGEGFYPGQTPTETPSSTTDSINTGRLLQYEDEETEGYNPWAEDGEYYPDNVLDSKDPNDPKSVLYTTVVVRKFKTPMITPIVKIVGGGINVYRGGLIQGTNGLDVDLKISNARGIKSLNFIQTVKVSNDDKITVQEAKSKPCWISSNKLEIGFVDDGTEGMERLFYYTNEDLAALAERGSYVFDIKTGNGKIIMNDNPGILNSSYAYNKTVFHTYLVGILPNDKQVVFGRLEWVFFKEKGKVVPWKENNLRFIVGGLTETDRRIVETSYVSYQYNPA